MVSETTSPVRTLRAARVAVAFWLTLRPPHSAPRSRRRRPPARSSSPRASRAARWPSSLRSHAHDELGADGELVRGPRHGLAGHGFANPCQLEHDAPGLDHRDPTLRVALPGAHAGLGGLLRHGLVREDV